MVNIGQIQQQTGPRPLSAEKPSLVGRSEPVPPTPETQNQSGPPSLAPGKTPTPQVRSADPANPEQIRDYLSRVAEAIEKATDGPHLVGFRLDPETGGYLVEVRSPDGEVLTTLSPEKFLNRPRNTDELMGTLVDSRS
jgi:hypothetical protein